MNPSEKIFLKTDKFRVTESEVVIDGRRYPLHNVSAAKAVSESSYQSKTVPFVLAVVFTVWMLSKLVNGTAADGYALIAGVLAVLSMVAVRLAGRYQKHALWLTLPEGTVAVYHSRSGAEVGDAVKAVNQALAFRRPAYTEAWGVGKPVNG